MNSQLISSLMQIKEIVDFEEELPQPFQRFSQRLLFHPAVHMPGVVGKNKLVSVNQLF